MTIINHNSAALLVNQLKSKDEEITLLRHRLGAIEWWITDVKTLERFHVDRDG